MANIVQLTTLQGEAVSMSENSEVPTPARTISSWTPTPRET